MAHEEEVLENIRNVLLRNNAPTLINFVTNTLERDTNTVLKGGATYLHELFQNANDVEAKNISVTYTEGYIIFQHDGKHFEDSDVRKICDHGQIQDDTKSKDISNTGYKNVGFKTVFCFAKQVYILSKKYSFRFDEKYWVKTNQSAPWMILPISTPASEVPKEVAKHIKPELVTFIFHIEENFRDEIRHSLVVCHEKLETLLFLQHLAELKISLLDRGLDCITIKRKQVDQNILRFNVTGNVHPRDEQWFVMTTEPINKPASVQNDLNILPAQVCPERLKNKSNKIEIQFALKFDSSHQALVDLSETSALYVTLPTQQRCRLPFLVSASFLLEANRQDMISHPNAKSYTHFLFELIGEQQFKLAELLSKKYPFEVLKIIGFEFHYRDKPEYESAYRNGFSKGSKEVRFIRPHQKGGQMLTLQEAKFDETRILYDFNIFSAANLIAKNFSRLDKLEKSYPKSKISFNEICKKIECNEAFFRQNLQHYAKLLWKLMKLCTEGEKHLEYQNQILTRKIFLNSNNVFQEPSKLFLLTDDIKKYYQPLELVLMHPEIYKSKHIPVADRHKWKDWLLSLGMKDAAYNTVIEKYLLRTTFEMIYQRSEDMFFGYLYSAFKSGVSLTEYEELKALRVKTSRESKKSSLRSCLFSQDFQPDICYETTLPDADFISNYYIALLDPENPLRVKNFFIELGVIEEICWHNKKQVTATWLRASVYSRMVTGYLAEIKKSHQASKGDSEWVFADFPYIDLMWSSDICGMHGYQNIFFNLFTQHFRTIKSSKLTDVTIGKSKRQVESFFIYMLRNIMNIVTTQNQNMKLTLTFSPHYQLLDSDIVPSAATSVLFTEEHIAFLGFIRVIPSKIVIKLLEKWSTQGLNSVLIEKIKVLFRAMLNNTYEDEDIKKFRHCKLPAANGFFMPAETLRCYDVSSDLPPDRPTWLKEIPGMTRSEMLALSTLFSVKQCQKLKITYKQRKNDVELRTKLNEVLPVFAIYIFKQSYVDPLTTLQQWANIFSKLKIFHAHAIESEDDDGHPTSVYYDPINQELTYTESYEKSYILTKIATRLAEKILKFDIAYRETLMHLLQLKNENELLSWGKHNYIHDLTTQQNYLAAEWEALLQADPPPIANDADKAPEVESLPVQKRLRQEEDQAAELSKTPQNQEIEVTSSMPPLPAETLLPAEDNTFRKKQCATHIRLDKPDAQDESLAQPLELSPEIIRSEKSRKSETKTSDANTTAKKKNRTLLSSESKPPKIFTPTVNIKSLCDLSHHTKLFNVTKTNATETTPLKVNSTPKQKKHTPNFTQYKKYQDSALDAKTSTEIGLMGEAWVFFYLYRMYKTQKPYYQSDDVQETIADDRFTLKSEAKKFEVTVVWHNKPASQEGDLDKAKLRNHDIKIYKKNEKPGKEKKDSSTIVEVKSTTKPDKRTFQITGSELNKMKKYKNRYRFYRVLDVQSNSPTIEVIKNPYDQLSWIESNNEGFEIKVEEATIKYTESVIAKKITCAP